MYSKFSIHDLHRVQNVSKIMDMPLYAEFRCVCVTFYVLRYVSLLLFVILAHFGVIKMEE